MKDQHISVLYFWNLVSSSLHRSKHYREREASYMVKDHFSSIQTCNISYMLYSPTPRPAPFHNKRPFPSRTIFSQPLDPKPSSTGALFPLQKCLASSLHPAPSKPRARTKESFPPHPPPHSPLASPPFLLLSPPHPPPSTEPSTFLQRPQYCFEFSRRGVVCCG